MTPTESTTCVPGSAAWRAERCAELLRFARGSAIPAGFGWLDDDGRVRADRDLELWINARMTYVFSRSGDEDLRQHGLSTLRSTFADPRNGGWFSTVSTDGQPADSTKSCYAHAFVILAASHAGDRQLLDNALQVFSERFFDDDLGWVIDSRSADWTEIDDYRGANAAMHTVEAWLAAAAVTGESIWLDRAHRIADRLINVAAENEWRIVEHFTADLTPLPEHNADRPADPFRPYGATPGHGFEWSRLLCELGLEEPATKIFERAARDGLSAVPGLPYTTNWSGNPVVSERFHWVMCEAVMAAEQLGRDDLASRWWSEIAEHFIDSDRSWWHELSLDLTPSRRTWSGKPDAYHAFNALTFRD